MKTEKFELKTRISEEILAELATVIPAPLSPSCRSRRAKRLREQCYTPDGTMKRCRTCSAILLLEAYESDVRSLDGLSSNCRRCAGDNARKSRWAKRYGLSVAGYYDLLNSQNGGCAICGKEPEGRYEYLAVDHDHLTGKVRGLLCAFCNLVIGRWRDSPQNAEKSVAYLKKHSQLSLLPTEFAGYRRNA